MTQPKLRIVPCHLDEAKAFVAQHHRHHRPPVGHKFSLAVADEEDKVRAVCIVGRPVARMLDDGMTLELTRLASDGCPNACSCLYGAAWRAAKALGYGRLITYILDDEPGVTLKAAGWKCIGQRGGAAGLCRVGREWTSTRFRRNSYGKLVELRYSTRVATGMALRGWAARVESEPCRQSRSATDCQTSRPSTMPPGWAAKLSPRCGRSTIIAG